MFPLQRFEIVHQLVCDLLFLRTRRLGEEFSQFLLKASIVQFRLQLQPGGDPIVEFADTKFSHTSYMNGLTATIMTQFGISVKSRF